MNKPNTYRDARLNLLIGNLLRIGVLLCIIVISIGIILGIIRGDLHIANSFNKVHSSENAFITFYQGLLQLKTQSIIELGILIMLFTPILRIIFAIIGFLKEKDTLYTLLSIIVLGIIALSFFLGFEH